MPSISPTFTFTPSTIITAIPLSRACARCIFYYTTFYTTSYTILYSIISSTIYCYFYNYNSIPCVFSFSSS